ncbi:MAG: acyl-CoA thioesterase [Bacteroidetes bacterium]|nr:acyl-CoA thioesterase [Bacteroidota bacterium]MBL0139768.1 acyl-CoA thioesterase [Bacteroidota bacterium]
MYTSEVQVRVRYAETDQMGYVYYGNYAAYFEVARVEALRSLGFSYKKLEEDGVMLPVLDFSVKYFKPAFYDDVLTIRTTIRVMPQARIHFEYDTYNEKEVLLNSASTTLVFINRKTNRPCPAPEDFRKSIGKYFDI